jgi:hypothetical protein
MTLKPRRWLLLTFGVLIALVLLIQLIPYGRAHVNPPVTAEPTWDAASTRLLAKRACFDCHSNETRWPAYASLAPVSWLVQRDVEAGRAVLNFSEWQRRQKEAHDAAEKVRKGDMPLPIYAAMHGDARLTPAEREALARGLEKTIGGSRTGRNDEGEHRED